MNSTPYLDRGWCCFESGTSTIDAADLMTVKDGTRVYAEKSPVPLTPARFDEEVMLKHFTNVKTDASVVSQFYARIFPALTTHTSMRFHDWDDGEVRQLLSLLPELHGLTHVVNNNNFGESLSKEV